MTETTQQTSWMDAPDEVVDRACAESHPEWSWVMGRVVRGWIAGSHDPRTDPRDAINFCNSQGCEWEKTFDGKLTVYGDAGPSAKLLKDATPESLADAITRGTLQVMKPEGRAMPKTAIPIEQLDEAQLLTLLERAFPAVDPSVLRGCLHSLDDAVALAEAVGCTWMIVLNTEGTITANAWAFEDDSTGTSIGKIPARCLTLAILKAKGFDTVEASEDA